MNLMIKKTHISSIMSYSMKNESIPWWSYVRGMLVGVGSGVTKLIVGHPFDTLKVRLQSEGLHGRFTGPIDAFRQTLQLEGIRGLYKGSLLPLFGWGLIDTILWSSLIVYRRQFEHWNQQRHPGTNLANNLSITQHALAGSLAGITSVSVVVPIEQVKARLQVQYADPTSQRYAGVVDCVRQLVRNNGVVRGLYQGFTGTLLFRMCFGPYFACFEFTKNRFNTFNLTNAMSPTLINFTSGSIAAVFLWTVFYPTDILKNKLMSQPDTPVRRYPTLRSCVKQVYASEGIRGFYRGITPCLLRAVPTNGAALVVSEYLLKHLPE